MTDKTASDPKKLEQEARIFRMIRGAWFWAPTILYTAALMVCFICNLAVNHTLSWFFIVLAALLCAYTFIPTITFFFKSNKLPAFFVSTFLSVCLLLFTCAVYTDGFSWLLTALLGVSIGYVVLFLPLLLAKTKVIRYRFVISAAATFALTILLLWNIHSWHPFRFVPAILITCYAFIPVFFCSILCTQRVDAFLKAGICTAFSAILAYGTEYIVNLLFGIRDDAYVVDLRNWAQCSAGNTQLICLVSLLLLGAVFIGIGVFRMRRNKSRP